MAPTARNPVIAFVWRSQEIIRPVVEMAHQTGTCAIFDISDVHPLKAVPSLKDSGGRQVKVSAEHFMDASVEKLLSETPVDTLWIEYHPSIDPIDPDRFIERIHELGTNITCVPIVSDPELLTRLSGLEPPLEALGLKGNEASGFVGAETTAMLFTTIREYLKNLDKAPLLFIWGGIGTPEAAAAFLTSGAQGIVFESLHWLTDMVSVNRTQRQRLERVRFDHTTIVGQDLGVPCRVFSKGNSQAVKSLREFMGSLCSGDIGLKQRAAFAARVRQTAVSALESPLDRQDLVLLVPEAAFAAGFSERFGKTTREALDRFMKEILRVCKEAPLINENFSHGPITKKLGTRYPVIQGAMSWISDKPEFALAVADAGGLPTLALGLRSRDQLERELGSAKEILGDRPYAVNFVALPENPHRNEQLAWIKETSPPFAVIAAGDPSFASELRQEGIQVVYLAPGEGLIRMALEAGVDFIVLEGNEAGGHVGEHSTLTLAQIALEMKRSEPDLFEGRHIILAGGIFNRETAFRAAMVGAEAVQMGTAYLATREIVATGALSPLYQRLVIEAAPGQTSVSGESIGLRVRSLNTPKVNAIHELEKDFIAGHRDEAAIRPQLENLSANSLLIAARGVEDPDGPSLDEETCIKEGQFMSGAIAGTVNRIYSVAELHREVAEGEFRPTTVEIEQQRGPSSVRISRPHVSENGNLIAITGMSLVNALGNNPQEIWEASLAMKSGISEIPPSRWDHTIYHDPDPRAQGKTYCKVGAFQNISISRKELGIAPQDFRTMSFATKLTLWLAEHAIRQSGILDSDIPRERIGVLISQNSGETAATVPDLVFDVYTHEIIRSMRDLIPMSPDLEEATEQKIKSGRISVDDTTLLGRLNCAAGGFICNKYGFMGPSYSVSAACATSLVALYSAIQMIKNGIIDAAVVGGGEELLQPAHYLEFSALRALAGLSGQERPAHESSRPFDASRDGMVLGEGGGMIVIERASTAEKRGARVHAYITGIGASNNHQGMVESLAETQKIAINASFQEAGYGPERVDLVECHATGTVQGDMEEVKALKDLFKCHNPAVLTSFKSQIGHTLGASGLNNLIHGIAAMQSGIYPPTLNYRMPDPNISLESCGFRVPVEPMDWPRPNGGPRHLMVNAFGFGGANYVVQLQECMEDSSPLFAPISMVEAREKAPSSSKEASQKLEGVFFLRMDMGGRPYRLGVLAEHETEAREKVAALDPVCKGLPPTRKCLRTMARKGIFAGPCDQTTPPLAFVFAGQGSQYAGMGKALYDIFPPIRQWMNRIAAKADFDLLDILFSAREEDLRNTRLQQPALFALEYAMVQHLISLGVKPRAMAGHSLGELVALSIAGVFSYEDGFRIVNKRAECMDKAARLNEDPGTMVAVDGPMEVLEAKVADRENIYFTNFNSPRQVVLGGGTDSIMDLMEELKREGYRATQLRVSMAFHSPVMKVIHDEMKEFISDIPFHRPRIPVISNTTTKPFPDDPEEIKKILMAHLESPVHWMQNVTALWEDYGVRTFVEIGPKDTLCNLIADTFEQARCINTCIPESEARAYRSAAARLYADGHLEVNEVAPKVGAPSRGSTEGTLPEPKQTEKRTANLAVADVVQREINCFVLESFGRFLKPQIVEAVRREVDPSFTEKRLEELLSSSASQKAVAGAMTPHPPEKETAAPASFDYLEELIQIIMETTGYERDEIEPDMDIRQDLAIRSSRLPVIMDAAERRFGITMNIEDYIGLRTVREVADRIAEVAGLKGTSAAKVVPIRATVSDGETLSGKEAEEGPPPVKRLIFREEPLTVGQETLDPLTLEPGQKVALFNLSPGSELASRVESYLEEELKAGVLSIEALPDPSARGPYDLRNIKGAERALGRITEEKNLSGLVFVLDRHSDNALGSMESVPGVLTRLFMVMKSLMGSSQKTFCLLVQKELPDAGSAVVAAEGILGMFLTAAHEYGSVLFRSVTLDEETSVRTALARALDRATKNIQLIFHGDDLFTLKACVEPAPMKEKAPALLQPGDLVVISGGAKGITSYIAKALAPFRPKLVLLGTSLLDSSINYDEIMSAEDTVEDALRRLVGKRSPDLDEQALESETRRLLSSLEVAKTLKDLGELGLEVSYHTCDVSDPDTVNSVLDKVIQHHGRINGIIHGAGILKDALMHEMTPAEFADVVNVKLLGGWNLFSRARGKGLRFMIGLSSVSAIQGNPGQVNYCAANRALSGLIKGLTIRADDGFVGKALILPPIEGTGMADDPELRELLKLKGMESAYVHVTELAEFFCRELVLGPHDQKWVMLTRTLPDVPTTHIDLEPPSSDGTSLESGGVIFHMADLPMIDRVNHMDLAAGRIEAQRNISHDRDLWLKDHRPFKLLKQPLFSGIMAVETLMEAAHLLHPYLDIRGIRQVKYKDVLDCPPGIERAAKIIGTRQGLIDGEAVCRVTFSSAGVSPSGRRSDRWTTNYEGEVILGVGKHALTQWDDFPVSSEELDTPPISTEQILKAYEEGTALKGRYRVLHSLDGTGPGVVKGSMLYRESDDFADLSGCSYRYSPYLLEGLMHIVAFYTLMREGQGSWHLIPGGIDEMRFARRCGDGEHIILEARLRSEDSRSYAWDARGVDESGAVIMQVTGLQMMRFAR